LLAHIAKRLQQSGVVVLPNSTPRQLAQQLNQQSAIASTKALEDWLMRLEALRYARVHASHGSLKQQLVVLRQELKRIRLHS